MDVGGNFKKTVSMKYISSIILLCNLTFAFVNGQKDSVSIVVPDYTESSIEWKIRHMWIGCGNRITTDYIDNDEFIKILTDNGKVIKVNNVDSIEEYYIVPSRPGKVNIRAQIRIWKGNHWDTLTTRNSFIAINSPKIITVIDEKYLRDSLDIKYLFVEASTKKENKRYQLAAFPPSIIVYKGSKKIGEIFPFTERDEIKSYLIKGNRLHFPSFVLRDMKTGLLTGPQELDYIIK